MSQMGQKRSFDHFVRPHPAVRFDRALLEIDQQSRSAGAYAADGPRLEGRLLLITCGILSCEPQFSDFQTKEACVKTILCIFALLVLTASSADAYVRRAVGGGYVARGGYHPVARGAAVAAGTAVAVGAAAATAPGWGAPGYGYGGGAWPVTNTGKSVAYTVRPFNCQMDCDNYHKNLNTSGYNPGNDYNAAGLMKTNITP